MQRAELGGRNGKAPGSSAWEAGLGLSASAAPCLAGAGPRKPAVGRGKDRLARGVGHGPPAGSPLAAGVGARVSRGQASVATRTPLGGRGPLSGLLQVVARGHFPGGGEAARKVEGVAEAAARTAAPENGGAPESRPERSAPSPQLRAGLRRVEASPQSAPLRPGSPTVTPTGGPAVGCGLGPGQSGPSPPRGREQKGWRGRWPPRVTVVEGEEPREPEGSAGRPLGLPSWGAGLPRA